MFRCIWKHRKKIFCFSIATTISACAIAMIAFIHNYQIQFETRIPWTVGSELKISNINFKLDVSQKISLQAPTVLAVHVSRPKMQRIQKVSAVQKLISKISNTTEIENIKIGKEQIEESDLNQNALNSVIAGTWVSEQKKLTMPTRIKLRSKITSRVRSKKTFAHASKQKPQIIAHLNKVRKIHLPRKNDAIAYLLTQYKRLTTKMNIQKIKNVAVHKKNLAQKKSIIQRKIPKNKETTVNGLALLTKLKSKDQTLIAYSDAPVIADTQLIHVTSMKSIDEANEYSNQIVKNDPMQDKMDNQSVEMPITKPARIINQDTDTTNQSQSKILVKPLSDTIPPTQMIPINTSAPMQVSIQQPVQNAVSQPLQQLVEITKPLPSLSQLQKEFAQIRQEKENLALQPSPTVGVPQDFTGKIMEAFTGGAQPVANATLQILGTPWTTQTDSTGTFIFPQMAVLGVLPLVITKEGYLTRRIEIFPEQSTPVIELVSENSAALSALAAHEKRNSGTSLIFGELSSPIGESTQAMKIEMRGPLEMDTPNTLYPVYLDEGGIPQTALEMTSSRGQFLFLNLQPGTYSLNITDAFGQERAPHLLYIAQSEGLIRKFSMGESKTIKGRLFNAASLNIPVDQAQVQLLGNSQITKTDAQGRFTLGPLYIDCATLNYLQVDKSGFYRNRIDYQCDTQNQEHPVYVFPSAYVDSVALDAQTKLQETQGVVLGHVSFDQSVKMQLWGPEEFNSGDSQRGKDFYFDSDGVLNASRNRTSENGNFAILEAPAGFSYMQAFNKDNRTLSYWPIFTSASIVNVYIQ